jgi:hypothetical protein
MAITLDSVRKVRADQPPRIIIYGPEKIGKTTLAQEFPAPVFLQTEQGEGADMEIDSFGHLTTFGQVLDAIGVLASEDHAFQTVVLDSVSEMEKLIWAEVCTRNNWQSIEQPGYGKGYVETDYAWAELIEALNYLRTDRRMIVVLVAHSTITRFDDPETQSYNRYDIDLHKRAEAFLKREVDAILLVKKDVTIKTEQPNGKGRARADGGDTRYIYTQSRPAFTAGNRYNMPDRLIYKKGDGFKSLAAFFPANRASAPEKKAA